MRSILLFFPHGVPGAVEGPDTPGICVSVVFLTRGIAEYPQLYRRFPALVPVPRNRV